MQIRFKLEIEDFHLLRVHFTPDAGTILDFDSSENCWEDITNASLSYLIKNSLGKGGGKSQTINVSASNQIKPLQDIDKLKQNITQVCEKISKGARIEF